MSGILSKYFTFENKLAKYGNVNSGKCTFKYFTLKLNKRNEIRYVMKL